MLGLPIAIEVNAPDAPQEQVAILLSACGRASAEAECIPAEDVGPSGSRAVAIVTWHGDGKVVIEVGLRKEGRPEWRSRTLQFQPLDEVAERWRTVGFVVGTLSRPEYRAPDEVESADTSTRARTELDAKLSDSPPEFPATEQPDPAPPKPSSPAPARGARSRLVEPAHETAEPSRLTVDLGGVVGPALHGVRAGGLVRARVRVLEPLGAFAALRYAERPLGSGTFGGRWVAGSIGLAALFGTRSLELALQADARVELFQGRAETAGGRDEQSRWLTGVGLGLQGCWMISEPLGFFVGGDGAWMFGTTDVFVANTRVATDPALRVGGEGGVRIRVW